MPTSSSTAVADIKPTIPNLCFDLPPCRPDTSAFFQNVCRVGSAPRATLQKSSDGHLHATRGNAVPKNRHERTLHRQIARDVPPEAGFIPSTEHATVARARSVTRAKSCRSSSGKISPGPGVLRKELLAAYKKDKFLEYQEFRRLGYNRRELKVNKETLSILMEVFRDFPACDGDALINRSASALWRLMEGAIQVDTQRLNDNQREILRDVIDLSQLAFAAVMQAALHLPLGQALSKSARVPEASQHAHDDIAELRTHLKAAQNVAREAGINADNCYVRLSDECQALSCMKDSLNILRICMRELERGSLRKLVSDITPAAPGLKATASKTLGAVKTSTAYVVDRFPFRKAQWEDVGTKLCTWVKQAGPAVHDYARLGVAYHTTQFTGKYRKLGTLRNQAPPCVPTRLLPERTVTFRELQRLHVESIFVSISAYCESSRALETIAKENRGEVHCLQRQRLAAIARVEQEERDLSANYAAACASTQNKKARHSNRSRSFLQDMDRAFKRFWEGAAALDCIVDHSMASAGAGKKQPVSAVARQLELINAIAIISDSKRKMQNVAIKFTSKPLDMLSVDWRIARDMGRFFCMLQQEYAAKYPRACLAEFDRAVEDTIERLAKEFRKTSSPQGRQMATRAGWAFHEAVAGLLQHDRSWQEVVNDRPCVDEYLARTGQRSLVGRVVFAGVSGKMPGLFQVASRNLFIPNYAILKVLFSPATFWTDYRKLSRSVMPGEAFPWGGYGIMAGRNGLTQAFRMLKFLLPAVGKTGLSVALAVWALHRKGIIDSARMALTEGLVDIPLAGGSVGASTLADELFETRKITPKHRNNRIADHRLGHQPIGLFDQAESVAAYKQSSTASDSANDSRLRVARDATLDVSIGSKESAPRLFASDRWNVDCSIGENHRVTIPISLATPEPFDSKPYLESPEFKSSAPDQRIVLLESDLRYIKRHGAHLQFLSNCLEIFIKKRESLLAKIEANPPNPFSIEFIQRLRSDINSGKKVKEFIWDNSDIRKIRDQFNGLSGEKISIFDLIKAKILSNVENPEDIASFLNELMPERTGVYSVCKKSLDKLIKDAGVDKVTADTNFRIRFKVLNGDGVLEDDESASLPKRASLIDIALGDFYKEHWNGHIVVEGLPKALQPLFGKNSYYGYVFPVTQKLYDLVKSEISIPVSDDVLRARKFVWEGAIKRRLSELAAERPTNAVNYEIGDVLVGKKKLYTLQYQGHAMIGVNNIVAIESKNNFCLMNLSTGERVLIARSDLNSRDEKKQAKRKSLVLANVSSEDRLGIEARAPQKFYWGVAQEYVRVPLMLVLREEGPFPVNGELAFIPASSINAVAERMDRVDREIFWKNFDFRFTTSRDVFIHSLIQGTKILTEKLSLALTLSRGGGWLTRASSFGLTSTEVGLACVERNKAKTLEARKAAIDDIKKSVIFQGLTEVPELIAMRRALRKLG